MMLALALHNKCFFSVYIKKEGFSKICFTVTSIKYASNTAQENV